MESKDSGNIVLRLTVERFKLLAQKMQIGKFDWNEWKNYRDEKRRYLYEQELQRINYNL